MVKTINQNSKASNGSSLLVPHFWFFIFSFSLQLIDSILLSVITRCATGLLLEKFAEIKHRTESQIK